MYGLPQPLYPVVSPASQKMFGDTGSMYGLGVGRNTFYSIKSGNWSDASVWETENRNGAGTLPTATDDVYIRHTVANDITPVTINNLFISGTLTFVSGTRFNIFSVNGNLQCAGTLDMSAPSGELTFNLAGNNNYVANFIAGATGAATPNQFQYTGTGTQPIMNLPYGNLSFQGSGKKVAAGNITTTGFLSAGGSGIIDIIMAGFDLTVGGGFNPANGTLQRSASSGGILFIGAAIVPANNFFIFQTGASDVEFRNGLALNNFGLVDATVTGTWRFTTNAQTVSMTSGNGSSGIVAFPNVLRAEGINLSMASGNGVFYINNAIDGLNVGSTITNKGALYFNTTTYAMLTAGTLDVTSFANTVGYVYAGAQNVQYGAYWNLLISNGTKTLVQNTVLTANLTVNSTYTLQLATYDFTVGTTTTLNSSFLYKSGAGNVKFIGLVTTSGSGSAIDFSVGNPTVELQGGISINNNTINTGTGLWSFTTNSQDIKNVGFGAGISFNAPILIVGAITLSNSYTSQAIPLTHFNTINGTVAGSTFTNKSNYYIAQSATLPMLTGVFDYTSFSNIIGYVFNGNYTLPYTNYNGLAVGGTGTKTLGGNTTLAGNLNVGIATNGVLELSTFDLTVNGTCVIAGVSAQLSKTGSGSIIFAGLLTLNGTINTSINFTGNPNVEVRSGINNPGTTGTSSVNTGTGTWTFSTNNQSIGNSGVGANNTMTWNCNILISGAIIVTHTATNQGGVLTLTGTLNGNNAASTFDGRFILAYQNATQPMATGVLQTNAAANTWLYNKNGAQDIKGGTYRTLTLSVGGVKTLQGNVVVATLYTLSAPATLNLNGFTRT